MAGTLRKIAPLPLILLCAGVCLSQGLLSGKVADKDGNILINPKYQSLEDEGNNYVIVQREGKFGVVSSKGISTIPLIYDHITFNPHSGQFLALKKSAWVKVN